MSKIIVISGVIGSGKSTLARKISKEFNIETREEDIEDDNIIPKISNLYSTFDSDLIYEVQKHFINNSKDIFHSLEEQNNYVLDTFPFLSQKVFLKALFNLEMISEDQYQELYQDLFSRNMDWMVNKDNVLHIHCPTPEDIFNRILNRGSFEINSYNEFGEPNPEFKKLIQQLDDIYFLELVTEKTVFSLDKDLMKIVKNYLDEEQ